VYSERKLSKKDQSIGMIISTLHRIETKLENLPSAISNDIRPSFTGQILQAVEAIQSSSTAATPSAKTASHRPSLSQITSPATTGHVEADAQAPADGKEVVPISFSQHGVVVWPGIISCLPERFLFAYEQLGRYYVLDVEMERPPLPMWVNPFSLHPAENWLDDLPFALVKGLCEAFFSLFHPFTPFMDKHFFFSFTLGTVIKHGFASTIETCLILNVMALGCLAVRAYEEADFPLPGSFSDRFERPAWFDVAVEEPPGLCFFNEARRRMGFLMEKNDLSSCQYYLLSAYVTLLC
jgi:hypothetical protein